MAVLADGGFGVAVDVEGVRDLSPAPAVTVPDSQPDRGLCPGRRPGGGLGHADLVKGGWRDKSVGQIILYYFKASPHV